MSYLLILAFLFSGEPSIGLDTYLEGVANPELGDARKVAGISFSWGSLLLVLNKGEAMPVYADKQLLGLFFEGDGVLLYHGRDADEEAVLRYNTGKLTSLKVAGDEHGLTIDGALKRVFIRGDVTLSGLSQEKGRDLRGSFQQHRKFFERGRGEPADHLLARHRLNGLKTPFVHVEMATRHDELVYTLDMGTQKSESLYVLEKNEDRTGPRADYLNPATLSDQPLGRGRADFFPAPYLLSHVAVQLEARDQHLDLIVEEELILGGETKALMFSLISETADRFQLFPYNLKSVRDEKGRLLPFDHRNNSLIVTLAEKRPKNAKIRLRFELEGDILVRPRKSTYWQLGTFPWFPRPPLAGQYYTFQGTYRVAKPYTVFAPGITLNRGEEGDFHTLETRVAKPVQFATIHGGNYFFDETTLDGLTVRVASNGLAKKRAIEYLGELSRELINYYQSWLGPFPFKEFTVIELDGQGFGQAPPGMMFLTGEAFAPLDRGNRRMSKTAYQRIAHEIAHQYWGQVVKMGSWEERWFSEAFAEYSAALAVRTFQGEARYKNMVRAWQSHARQAAKVATIPTAHRIFGSDPMKNKLYRRYLTYDKGAYLLYSIHQDLGDGEFAQFLKYYQETFAWKFASTKEASKLLGKMSGQDYDAWFRRYFWGSEMPGKQAWPDDKH